jgi:hypothetical protein
MNIFRGPFACEWNFDTSNRFDTEHLLRARVYVMLGTDKHSFYPSAGVIMLSTGM